MSDYTVMLADKSWRPSALPVPQVRVPLSGANLGKAVIKGPNKIYPYSRGCKNRTMIS
jgi:hypothetical protein